MLLKHAIGDTIRIIRTSNSLTLRQLSERSYVSLGYLSEIERGYKEASTTVLEAVAKGLDVSTAQLIKEIYQYLQGGDAHD